MTCTSSSAHRKRRIPSLVDETQDTRLVRVSGKISRKEYTFSHGWKKKNLTRIYSLFVPEMSCCSLAAGSCRNDCSKVCIYIYIYTFPLLFFSISRKRHVVKHARCQTSPTTYSLSLLNYTRVKDPRGNAKKAIFKEYNFGRDIAASLVDKYRPPRHDKTYTKYAVSTDILGGGLGK